MRHRQSFLLDAADAILSRPTPFPQGIAVIISIIDMAFAVGISAAVCGRGIVADQFYYFAAGRPDTLSRLPFLDPLILRLNFPFLRALGLDGSVSFASQSPHFQHSSSPSPFETPD